jgi:CarD family transcriptional regulator
LAVRNSVEQSRRVFIVLDRMSREISSVNRISETEAIRQIEQNLAKSPRRGVKPEGVEAVPAQDKAA